MSDKIEAHHRKRAAYVYIRQSTMQQVKHHPESQRRQYALQDRARALGFESVVVVDDDLGRSGSGAVARPGFTRLLSAVCAGEVGAVLAIEASRLARNNRDWHHLLDLCALTSTLLIDHDGIYDPHQLNDRLLLGLKGTMSEFELSLLRQRAREAMQEMIRRGEVLTEVPVGYERTADNHCEMTPDLEIQEAIHGVFQKFRELGSVRQVLIWYRHESIALPTRPRRRHGAVVWSLPTYPRILKMLRNPTYAGVFVHGRTQTRTVVVDGRAHKTRGHAVPRSEWPVVLHGHHPGYIAWEEYLRNQDQIAGNTPMRGDKMSRGAAKRGSALLAGLLRCARCGRMLHVQYSGRGGREQRYVCRADQFNRGGTACLSFSGMRVEHAVTAAVLEALRPAGVQAAEDAWQERDRQEGEKERALRRALEKARYHAERIGRQYDAIEPENRLVAGELERRWNEALVRVTELEVRVREAAESEPPLTESERNRLQALGADLEVLWEHPEASSVLRKRILRTVLEEIVADAEDDPRRIVLRLHWSGGVHTLLYVRRNATGEHSRSTNREGVELVRELAEICPDREIARILNRLGHRTGAGNRWVEARVRSLRSYQKIPVFQQATRRTWLNLAEAARELGVSATVVRRLIRDQILEARQVVAYAPWQIERDSLAEHTVQRAARAIREGHRTPRTAPDQNDLPFNSTT